MRETSGYSVRAMAERRQSDRLPVALDADALVVGDVRRPVRVIDVSSGGLMFESAHGVMVGARIWLFLGEDLTLNLRVVWSRPGQSGCAFVRPLSDADARSLAALSQRD